jgi:cardiolipin synthase
MALLGLVLYAIDSHTRRKRRHPSASIAWFVSLLLLPYLAFPLYLFFGRRKIDLASHTDTQKVNTPKKIAIHPMEVFDERLAKALGLAQAVSIQNLTIHPDGRQALQALEACITGAKETLDICTFIFGGDVKGYRISQLLIERAKQGVQVRLLIDSLGCFYEGMTSFKDLRNAGVEVVLFALPLSPAFFGKTNMRIHRKLVIADSIHLWSGGRNLTAKYFEIRRHKKKDGKPWVDLSFDLYGDLAYQAQNVFEADWAFAKQLSPPNTIESQVTVAKYPELGARLVPSGPDRAEDTIYTMLVSGCYTAQSRILIATPYFVPDNSLLTALELAAQRGVSIDLLVPVQSNLLADIARRVALRDLSNAGANIWLFPAMLHAKAFIFDDSLALVGSANLDERSLFLNYELMVAFYDASVIQKFASWIALQRDKSTVFNPKPPSMLREISEGVVRWIAFQL